MVRSLLHPLALLALIGALLAVAVSSSSAAPQTHRASASGCTTLHSDTTDLVEQCGPCLVLTAPNATAMATTLHDIGQASPGGAWLTVGSNWVGADKATSFSGALTCQSLLGGRIGRYP